MRPGSRGWWRLAPTANPSGGSATWSSVSASFASSPAFSALSSSCSVAEEFSCPFCASLRSSQVLSRCPRATYPFAASPNGPARFSYWVKSSRRGVRVDDPDLTQLAGLDVVVVDLAIEQTRTRDWMVTKVAVRPQRRLGRRSNVYPVDWQHVHGLTPSGLAMPDQGVAQLLEQFGGQRPVEVRRRHPRVAGQAPLRGHQRARRRTARRCASGAARRRAGGLAQPAQDRPRCRCPGGDGPPTTPPICSGR